MFAAGDPFDVDLGPFPAGPRVTEPASRPVTRPSSPSPGRARDPPRRRPRGDLDGPFRLDSALHHRRPRIVESFNPRTLSTDVRRDAIFYGWIVVAVTAIVVLVTAGVRSAPGAFLLSMTEEPGWSTATVSFAAAAGLVVFGLSGPLSGWLMGADRRAQRRPDQPAHHRRLAPRDQPGPRDLAADARCSGCCPAWARASSRASSGPTVATRWFVRHRGLVTGILGASTSTGQLDLLPAPDDARGRRRLAARGARARRARLVLLLPVVLWVRNDPADVGARPLGVTEGAIAPSRRPSAGHAARASAPPTSGSWRVRSSCAARRPTASSASISSRTRSTTGSRPSPPPAPSR